VGQIYWGPQTLVEIHSAYTALLSNHAVYCSVSEGNIWITSAIQIQITLAFRGQCNQQRRKGQGRWRDFNRDKWEGGTVSLSLCLAVNGRCLALCNTSSFILSAFSSSPISLTRFCQSQILSVLIFMKRHLY